MKKDTLVLCGARAVVIAGVLSSAATAHAEEGFWLFSAPPKSAMRRDFNFAPSQKLLDHLMKSAARFDSGGNSGAFVSRDGLWLTNNHIGRVFVRALKDKWPRIEANGFYANTPDEELKLPDTLRSTKIRIASVEAIEDVTKRVKSAGADEAARNSEMKAIEADATDATHRGQIVILYGGAVYQLMRLKIYSDVRLVFMPEQRIGSYAYDVDGTDFDYPQSYMFDVAIFRVYENGKPVHLKHYFSFSDSSLKAGELVMGSGTPGVSARSQPLTQFQVERDAKTAMQLRMERELEMEFGELQRTDRSTAAHYSSDITKLRSSALELRRTMDALRDSTRLERPTKLDADIKSRSRYAPSFALMDATSSKVITLYPRYFLLDENAGFQSNMLATAVALVRLESERAKPVGERLSELRDVEGVSKRIAEPKHYDSVLETINLRAWLNLLVECLGYNDPMVKAVLDGKSPAERARAAAASQIGDPQFRKQMLAPGAALVSTDPLLAIARAIDQEGRKARAAYEQQNAVLQRETQLFQQERYRLFGGASYPEANNTLRFLYGIIDGGIVERKAAPPWSMTGLC